MVFFPFIRRPIKAALAAASEHLAGLLPLHLVYSQAHETAIEVCHTLDYVSSCLSIPFREAIGVEDLNKFLP